MSVTFSPGQKLTPYMATQIEQWVTKSHKIIIKEEELDRANTYKALTVIDEMYALTATCT